MQNYASMYSCILSQSKICARFIGWTSGLDSWIPVWMGLDQSGDGDLLLISHTSLILVTWKISTLHIYKISRNVKNGEIMLTFNHMSYNSLNHDKAIPPIALPHLFPISKQPREQIEGSHQAVHLRAIQEIGEEGRVQLANPTRDRGTQGSLHEGPDRWSNWVVKFHLFVRILQQKCQKKKWYRAFEHPQSDITDHPNIYPLRITHSNWRSPTNGGLNRDINYTWWDCSLPCLVTKGNHNQQWFRILGLRAMVNQYQLEIIIINHF